MIDHDLADREPYEVDERIVNDIDERQWLKSLTDTFAAATTANGVRRDRYTIADMVVSLDYASPTLRRPFGRAFSHLSETEGDESALPALTVHIWDGATAGAPTPWRPDAPGSPARGMLYYVHKPPLRIAYKPSLDTISALDSQTGTAWYWVADPVGQPTWDQASPMRQIFFWWLSACGLLPVHGAALGTSEGGVLLVGKSGSGKSTTTLANLGSDLLYAGDDYVGVALEPRPWVHSLYGTGKLEAASIRELLPHLLPLATNPSEIESEKAVLYVREHFDTQMTSGFPLVAILVPRVGTGERGHRIREIPRAQAFAALAPNTMIELRTAGNAEFAAMSRLVQAVPCYGIEVGTDVSSIPQTIRELLAGLVKG